MKKIILLMMMVTTVVLCNSCKEGPMGEIGPKGDTGDQGVAGENGATGIDGKDGETLYGYDEALESGYIAVVLEGVRTDDVALRDSSVYKFCPLELITDFSSVEYDENNGIYNFGIIRLSDLFPMGARSAGIGIQIDFSYDGTNVHINEVYAPTMTVLGEDMKLCKVYIYDDMEDYVVDNGITNFSYDPDSGEVTMKVEMLIPGGRNSTGNDLTIIAYMDIVAYLNLFPQSS